MKDNKLKEKYLVLANELYDKQFDHMLHFEDFVEAFQQIKNDAFSEAAELAKLTQHDLDDCNCSNDIAKLILNMKVQK